MSNKKVGKLIIGIVMLCCLLAFSGIVPFSFALTPTQAGPIIDSGLNWLRTVQNGDGSWAWADGPGTSCVAMTAFAVLSFINRGSDPLTDTNVVGGLEYILSRAMCAGGASTDGSIVSAVVIGGRETAKVYETGIAIAALVAAWKVTPAGSRDSRWQPAIENAADYLLNTQCIGLTGRTPDPLDTWDYASSDTLYGGWGYPRPHWADLSNTQFALWGLRAAEMLPTVTFPAARKAAAIQFVSNCQNTNGGFTYQPGGGSYGSMSAAGLWSLWCCGVPATAAGVINGKNWFISNIAYNTNPGVGDSWYYYYALAAMKAFTMYGWSTLGAIDWYQGPGTFGDELANRQNADGGWPNWGGEPRVMTTTEAILALETRVTVFTGIWKRILSSPGDLHVYDPEGRHVGINYATGMVECEIPGAAYSGPGSEPQVITITDPAPGTYITKVVATGTNFGWYTLSTTFYKDNVVYFTGTMTEWIEKGEADEYEETFAIVIGPTLTISGPVTTAGPSIPVGGISVPIPNAIINKPELPVPWICLASFITAATVLIGYTKHKRKEHN